MDEAVFNSLLAVDGDNVCFSYGRKREESVLNGLNIKVQRGVIYGLLGPSGCGKTTLLKCIIGRHNPKSGTIRIYGKTPGSKGFTIPGCGLGFMPQELGLYPEISAEETLTYFGRLYQMDQSLIKERISFLTTFLDIPDKKKQIKNLSGGQQRRVSFAVALIHKPPLIILDEPTVGVDPLLRKSIWNHLQNLAARDLITIVITTHYVEEARQAQVVGFMRDGHLLAEANPETLITQFNALTLEDVFLKLCLKESESLEITVNGSKEQLEMQDVWVPRKIQRTKSKSQNSNNAYTDQCKIGLLNNDFDPDVTLMKDSSWGSILRTTTDRMGALISKSFLRLKRNIPLVFFQVFVPVFQVIVFCLCVGGEPFDIPIAVVNLEEDPLGESSKFLKTIDSYVITQRNYYDLNEAYESVKKGENWGVLHIGPSFTDSLITRYIQGIEADNDTIGNSTINLYLDMTNQQLSATIFSHIIASFQTFAENALRTFKYNPLIATSPIVLGEPIYGNLVPNFTEFMAPGMILGITYMMAVGLSSMSIIIEKKEGQLDRSWVAGVKSWEVVFSIFFSLFIVMLLQVTLVLIFTFLVFNIPTLGPLIWVIIAVLLVGLEGMSYGLFISSIVNDENIAMMIAMGSFYPNLLLSGIIWPVEAMPHYLRQFSYCLPMTLVADSMRSVLSRGWTITENDIWVGYLVTLAWIFPVILISVFFFKIKK
ncbi:ABC transporter G family member 20 isoform X1 [Parasteatoda tepidariorum]|uniref:ABC transporter G family member 20 isoform X1 n=2 Tax=Parasteatoda tepidariorum TaxID=114398 RepID=UPI001C71CC25|nr:ABC transporter G family member 20 isoform X1 [Parasteatoda tepidariorum]